MEQRRTDPGFRGARQCDLKKSFKLAVSSLLTSCSNEEFSKAFPSFTKMEQDSLHKLFIQVITSLHENIEYMRRRFENGFSPARLPYNLVVKNENSRSGITCQGADRVEEDEFESLCLESQVGTALDNVEQLVEEHALNPLLSDKTNVSDVVHDLQVLKESEIQYLKGMLEKVEEQNRLTRARVEVLRKEMKEAKGSTDACDKLRGAISSYRTNGWLHDI